MDIVLQSNFNEFIEQYEYSNLAQDVLFEKFSIFSIATKFSKNQTVTKSIVDDINIGNGNDWGLDGIIIVVNGRIVTSILEVEDIIKANYTLDVSLVFVQAKYRENIEAKLVSNSLDGIEDIFRDVVGDSRALPPANSDLDDYRNIIKLLFNNISKFNNKPSCYFYYSYCGKYDDNADVNSKIAKFRMAVEEYNLTSFLDINILDKDGLVDLYKETKSKNKAEIIIEDKMDMPDVNGVEESYICLISFSEFKKLFISTDDKIISSVFYDNVRDFQGMNVVNESIQSSIVNGEIDLFTAMNNGITIVVKEFHAAAKRFNFVDYQIVNGCQTCNVLYLCRNVEGINSLKLIVKVVSTKDKIISDRIIVANNSQTEVKREQLVSLTKTQQRIEDYYNAQNKFEKLYYERRSKQYRNTIVYVPQNKVITISAQIKAFVATFMEQPHLVGQYYGELLRGTDVKTNPFSEDIHPALYYTSALADFKMDELFSCGKLDKVFKKVKYHLLFAFKLMCEENPLKSFSTKEVESYCEHFCRVLCDEGLCFKAFSGATTLVKTVLGRDPRDADRNKEQFTNDLLKKIKEVNAVKYSKKS